MSGGPGASGGGEQLPRGRRLSRGVEIRALMRRGKRSRTDHLDVYVYASPGAHSRVGTVVPRHRRTAVERNLLKRRLREVLRREVLPRLEAGGVAVDVVVRARREAYGATYSSLRTELSAWLVERCGRGWSWP